VKRGGKRRPLDVTVDVVLPWDLLERGSDKTLPRQ
jgi:hypothetical protein